MNRTDHSFDWKGFAFAAKLFAICLVIGAGGHFGIQYAVLHFAPASPSALVAVQHGLPVPTVAASTLSSTTPQRIINSLTISDAVPQEGKFIGADLVNMKLYLYQDSAQIAEYPIATKGRPGTAWETPSGFYAVQTKEKSHFSSIGKVYIPYSMQFYGNYFIHGRTYYPDGTLTSATFSGGCIKLDTVNAEKVFAFADVGTKVFVYDSKQTTPPPSLALDSISVPHVAAVSYLVADIDTGDVLLEQNAQVQQPIASITKLMTALVTNETISFDKKVSVPQGGLVNPPDPSNSAEETFVVGDLLYPLLMQSSNIVADSLTQYYGKNSFIRWMNTTAQALNMTSTTYADGSGVSSANVSTPDDLFRLATYLSNKKSFVLNITHTANKTITAEGGSSYKIVNLNEPADSDPFKGGKAGHTTAAKDTMVSVLSFKVGEDTRRVAVIVLGSNNRVADIKDLAEWVADAAKNGTSWNNAACASCTHPPQYRKIEL